MAIKFFPLRENSQPLDQEYDQSSNGDDSGSDAPAVGANNSDMRSFFVHNGLPILVILILIGGLWLHTGIAPDSGIWALLTIVLPMIIVGFVASGNGPITILTTGIGQFGFIGTQTIVNVRNEEGVEKLSKLLKDLRKN